MTTRATSRQAVLDALADAKAVILTTHLNADGDGCGSEVGLASWLRERGTETFIVNPTPYPESFRFLLSDPSWVVDARSPEAEAVAARADLAVVLDTAEVPRIGRVKPLIEHLPKVVIDHHQPGDQPIEGVRYVDPDASAAGELVYDLLHAVDGPWSRTIVDALYVAILTDTGSFRFSNSSPAAHRVVGDLIARGADPEKLYRIVYGTYPLRRFRLLAHALETLEVDSDPRVASMTVPDGPYRALGATPDDLDGIVDYPRGVQGVEVGLLFRAVGAGGTKVSLRSNGDVDVNAVARTFGGGGHRKASGVLVDGSIDEVRASVVKAVREAVVATLGPLSSGPDAAPETPEPDSGSEVL